MEPSYTVGGNESSTNSTEITIAFPQKIKIELLLINTQWSIIPVKKNKIMSFAGKWVEEENIMLSKINQTENSEYCLFTFLYRI
jgi:hypothetical protein